MPASGAQERQERTMLTLVPVVARCLRRARMRWVQPIDEHMLSEAIDAVLPDKVEGLLVHSALRSCGYFVGGLDMIIRVLRQHATTLCMPTNSYCYPHTPGEEAPMFDPRVTGSLVGALTNAFWKTPDVLRSLHPTHAVAATGPAAAALISGHEACDTPCGDGTPYKKMIEAGFSVLLLGARLDAYTFFHTAEDEARAPYLYEPGTYDLRVRTAAGAQVVRMRRQDMHVPRRFAAMDRELESAGLLWRTPLGTGELLAIPDAARTHAFLVDLLRRDQEHFVSHA